MKTILILVVSLFFVNLAFAQGHAIKISNPDSGKEIIIKEYKRIKIRTADGRKISGRFEIEENNIISINRERFELTDIQELKRNPLLTSVLTGGLLIYGGAITAGFGAIIGVFIQPSGFLLFIPAAAMIYAGTKSPNFNRRYKNDGSWTFEIVADLP